MKAIRLRTEYLKDPLGIDLQRPRLFWNCADGVRQTACRILAESGGSILWDSGKVPGSAMRAVFPEQLHSRQQVTWQVKLWDESDAEGPWSDPARLELGLLQPEDWKARWVTGDYRVDRHTRYPVDCFRKVFTVRKPVQQARLYAAACGLYEARLGGEKVGNWCMAPGHTDYRKRVQYQTYDVTQQLRPGENELTFQLADGWYRGSCGAWGRKDQYGTETKLLAQLEIRYEDGSQDFILSGPSWEWSQDGPIRFADNKDGETIEAWRIPSYIGRAKITRHGVTPTASNNVPVTEHEHLIPTLITTPSGAKILDFGQNLAGWVAFTLTAEKNQRVFLRLGEMLDDQGEFTQENIQCRNKKITTPLQQVEYFCKDGLNRYQTTFAVFGFRYALVETDVPFRPEDFTAIALYSDLEQTGWFDSSSELLNRFVEATRWSAKGNHLDVPTDCPTRERHGWTGDSQLFFSTAAYLFDFAAFAQKHLNDVYDWQRRDGKLPQIAPYGGVDPYMAPMNGSVGWADVGILIPYRFWKQYGDRRVLARYYDGMARYARFMERRCGRWGGPLAKAVRVPAPVRKYVVNCGQSYGEWAEPADVHPMDWKDMAAPHPEVSTAYTAWVLGLMAEIARELGKTADEKEFRKFSEGCRLAYQAMMRLPEFSLDTDRQAQLVRPLFMGLLEEEQTAYAKERLLRAMEHYGWRLGTGFLSTPLILDVLAEIDPEAAYRLLENEEMPGWLFMPKNGATTVWESWEGPQAQGDVASLNHYSKGAVVEWLFRRMCGIRVTGENHFVIQPLPGGQFTHAKARYQSIYGQVVSGWVRQDDGAVYTVTVPANCTAEILLPDGQTRSVGAGEYRIATPAQKE